jgi:hypothetical protein
MEKQKLRKLKMNERQLKFLSYLQKQNGQAIDLDSETCNVVTSLGVKDLNELFDKVFIVVLKKRLCYLTVDGFHALLQENMITWNKEADRMVHGLEEDGMAVQIQEPNRTYWKAL